MSEAISKDSRWNSKWKGINVREGLGAREGSGREIASFSHSFHLCSSSLLSHSLRSLSSFLSLWRDREEMERHYTVWGRGEKDGKGRPEAVNGQAVTNPRNPPPFLLSFLSSTPSISLLSFLSILSLSGSHIVPCHFHYQSISEMNCGTDEREEW